MSLDKELEGVTIPNIDSPDDVDDDLAVDNGQEPDKVDDVPASDDAGADEGGKKPDRPLENVLGELRRKQTESERRIMAQMEQRFSQMTELMSGVLSKTGPQAAARTFDDLSVGELEAMQAQVPAESKKTFDDYLIKRKVDDQITQKVAQIGEDEKYRTERLRSNTIAAQRYPDVLNKTSAFYAEVNRRLNQATPEQRKFNTRIVLNIADDVAGEWGITPKPTSGRRLTTSKQRNETKPVNKGDEPPVNQQELDELAKKLAPAMRGRKFDMKRIAQRTAEYNKYFIGDKNNG